MKFLTPIDHLFLSTGLLLTSHAVMSADRAVAAENMDGPPSLQSNAVLQVAQAITPAADGTGTVVNQSGNQLNIEGGTIAGDNLFHSFEQLNVSPEQIANFLAQPDIQNILGRVVGGDPSVINGLVQVTGGDANLFLMNPAGIVFGPNAQISVPGSFTATAASGIQLEEEWFNAVGSNDYGNLVGEPTGFAFAGEQAGAVVNAGNIAVPDGESVTLVGGTVLNLGTIAAPGGDITIAAVPGEQLIRISQEGSLISLDLPIVLQDSEGDIQPVSVPELLAPLSGGENSSELAWVIDDDAIRLASNGANLPTQSGDSTVTGTLDVTSGDGVGGRVDILGEQVTLTGATITASGDTGGGQVRVGGDYQGQGIIPNAENTFISSDSVIEADAETIGDGGRVIVWADGATQFYGDISVQGGSTAGDGGFVEVSGHEQLIYRGQVNASAENGHAGTLLLDPEDIVITPGGSPNGFDDGVVNASDNSGTTTTITEAQLEDVALANVANIILAANNDIEILGLDDEVLDLATPTIDCSSGCSIEFIADADGDGNGSFLMYNREIIEQIHAVNEVGTIDTNGRNLVIRGASVVVGAIRTSAGVAELSSGNLELVSSEGDIVVSFIRTNGFNDGGNITIDANQLFRATGDLGVSIDASGNLAFDGTPFAGGLIVITHGGANGFVAGVQQPVMLNNGFLPNFQLIPDFTFGEGESGVRGGILSRNTNGTIGSIYTEQELTNNSDLAGTIQVNFEQPGSGSRSNGAVGSGSGSSGGGSDGGGSDGGPEIAASPEICLASNEENDCEENERMDNLEGNQNSILDVSEVVP